MQLSQTAEYALRAVVFLAEHRGEAQTTQQIAEGCRVPAGYLSKVLQPLARAGVVSAQRGLGGGYVLEHDPGTLTLLDVVSAVESIQRFRTCPARNPAHVGAWAGAGTTAGGVCGLHRALDGVMAGVEKALASVTVGSLVGPGASMRPLCEAAGATGTGFGGVAEAGTLARAELGAAEPGEVEPAAVQAGGAGLADAAAEAGRSGRRRVELRSG
ncbi:MAG: RrF2 family transcriptional regulator [Tepidisphaerales bacterium]